MPKWSISKYSVIVFYNIFKIEIFLQIRSVRPYETVRYVNLGRLDSTYRLQAFGISPLAVSYLVNSESTQ